MFRLREKANDVAGTQLDFTTPFLEKLCQNMPQFAVFGNLPQIFKTNNNCTIIE